MGLRHPVLRVPFSVATIQSSLCTEADERIMKLSRLPFEPEREPDSLGPPTEVHSVKGRGRHVYKLSLVCPTTFWGFDHPDVSILNQNITNSVIESDLMRVVTPLGL